MAGNIVNIEQLATWLNYHFNMMGNPLSPLKLQKILYYAQAWNLVFDCKNPLFEDLPEAWSNGPVYPRVYDMYKENWSRHQPIIIEKEGLGEQYNALTDHIGFSDRQKEVLEAVLNKYGNYPDEKLIFLTHSEQPWNEARKQCEPFSKCKIPITHDSMLKYYSSLVKQNAASE
jgi:uncharacterized phage-associated protein